MRLINIHRQGRDSGIIWTAHGFNAGVVADVTPFSDIEIVYVPANADAAPYNHAAGGEMIWSPTT